MVMYLGTPLPATSSDLPGSSSEAGHLILPYLVLHQVGFTLPFLSPETR